jgi:L-threonylcarbamoyladenylate synthase
MTLDIDDAARLEECLLGDGVAVVPTDTVYGLACNPYSQRAVERIYELKRRPPRKPSAVMFFSLEGAFEALPTLGPHTREALSALLPGPVTVLLANSDDLFAGAGGGPTLGVRVPRFEGPLAALADINAPALQSSANLSGEPDPRRLCEVPVKIRQGADLVLDGGELPGEASTVIDLSDYEQAGSWRLVREGPVGACVLTQKLG